MPEQLTKHPEITLQVLRSAGAQCGEGQPQVILQQCPKERFCKLPGGEVCVYGLPDATRMTQVSQAEWRGLLPAAPPNDNLLVAGGTGLLAGVALGVALMAIWRRQRSKAAPG